MISGISLLLSAAPSGLLKPRLRRWRSQVRTWYVRRRYAFGDAELLEVLRACNIASGDALLVHSAFGGFEAFRGGVADVIRVLEEAVGPEGTLLMPTLSFRGIAVAHARRLPVFDPTRTPSQVGLISEIFRRRRGVTRSLHPTHSVAGTGPAAGEFLADHHLAATPCGKGTPFHRLIERDGKVLLLNTGFSALTLYHCIEELIEPLLPASPFTRESFVLPVLDGGRRIESAPMRLFDPDLSARRTLEPLRRHLARTGRLREARIGNVGVMVVRARDALAGAEELAGRGIYCYAPDRP